MPDYAIYNPVSTPVINIVTQLLYSFDEGKEETLPGDRIKNPDLSGVNTNAPMKWTGSGVTIVNLTQTELDSIKAVEDAAYISEVKQAAKDIFLNPEGAQNHAISLGFETMATLLRDQINLVRANFTPAMPPITMGQLSNSFKTIYEQKVDNITAP